MSEGNGRRPNPADGTQTSSDRFDPAQLPRLDDPDGPLASGDDPEGRRRAETGRLGMVLFLAALGMLFGASMVAFLVVRLRAEQWLPPGTHRLPAGLWVGTLILLASSLTMHRAQVAVRRGRMETTRLFLGITFLLGVAFLTVQGLNWAHLIGSKVLAQGSMYAFTFYMLTGLHGAHVLGGLVPLGLTTWRAGKGRYTPRDHAGVRHTAMYWHFLDAVWIVMYTVMLVAL